MKVNFSILCLTGVAIASLTGCGHTNPPASAPLAKTTPANLGKAASPAPVSLSDADLSRFKPNEAGVVPILEYHAIDDGKTTMSRTADQMRQDLERLYNEGYRAISLQDFLAHRIEFPPGKSPVVLTFDDARPTQFQFTPDGKIDPDCAVGILQEFHQKHPDFPLKATFFVLPTEPGFGSATDRKKKMEMLLQMGFEIGNHTLSHTPLKKLTDAQVQQELAGCLREIHAMVPDVKVETLALPLGIHARNRKLEVSGISDGQTYKHSAILLVGANPAPSPISKTFDPMRLPRIQACAGFCGITYWLDDLKKNSQKRYISDGDPNTITVPRSLEEKINPASLNGKQLRTYER